MTLQPGQWRDYYRTQLVDIVLTDIEANPDPQIRGYRGMAERTGIPAEVIKDRKFKAMMRQRATWNYPRKQLDWDASVQSFRLVGRVDAIRTKTLATHAKTANTHYGYIADIARLDNLSPAHQMAAGMARDIVSIGERMVTFLSEVNRSVSVTV